jgi:hypothetical protein
MAKTVVLDTAFVVEPNVRLFNEGTVVMLERNASAKRDELQRTKNAMKRGACFFIVIFFI